MFNDVPILSNGFQEKSIFYSRVTLLMNMFTILQKCTLSLYIYNIYILYVSYIILYLHIHIIYILYIYIYIYNIIYIQYFIFLCQRYLVSTWSIPGSYILASMDHCGILQLKNDVLKDKTHKTMSQ